MPQPAAVDLEALSDLCTPWCLRVAVTLRIAERIAAGTTRAGDLAAEAGCDAGALQRVLGHLVHKGVFAEPHPGQFALNPAAEHLRDPGLRLILDLESIGGRFAHAWGTLLAYTRTGRPAYHELFGQPFWEDLASHPQIAADFDAFMGIVGHGVPDAQFQVSGGWESLRSVVDVGGGTGAMLAEILRLRPHLQGTLVDLPATVARAGATFEAAGVADRVAVSGQSFFDPLPAGADMYLLKSVLNDWPDRETLAILRRCAEAAHPGSCIVIIGGVTDDAPQAGRPFDTELVLVGGRSASLSEFRALARQAGLEVVSATHSPSGRFVVECRPLQPALA